MPHPPTRPRARIALILLIARVFGSRAVADLVRTLEGDEQEDTKAREKLGLDPDELGSPWGAASGSLLSFAAGAAVPLVPFLVSSGRPAFVGAVILSSIALFAVGAGVSLVTGGRLVYSGVRQVLIGAFAAAVTFGVGWLIGVAVA